MIIKDNSGLFGCDLYEAIYSYAGQHSCFYKVVKTLGKTQAIVRRVPPVYAEYHDDGYGQNGWFKVDIMATLLKSNEDSFYKEQKVTVYRDDDGNTFFKPDQYMTAAFRYREGSVVDLLSD